MVAHDYIPAHSNNYSKARNALTYIVLHGTGGTHDGTIAWLQNPAARVSYHYLVSKRGGVVRMLPDSVTAWHCGVSSWREGLHTWYGLNQYSIGIGLESWNKQDEVYPPEQVEACKQLVLGLMESYMIAPCRILSHEEISGPRKRDPVAFNIEAFRKGLNA